MLMSLNSSQKVFIVNSNKNIALCCRTVYRQYFLINCSLQIGTFWVWVIHKKYRSTSTTLPYLVKYCSNNQKSTLKKDSSI